MVFKEFLISMGTVVVSELGDKSHIIVLLLAAKYKDHKRVFIGAMSAFYITVIMSVLLGSLFSGFLGHPNVKIFIGISMLLFGIYTFLSHEDGPVNITKHSPLISAFVMILIAEMGDKSQFVSGILAGTYNPVLVAASLLVGFTAIVYGTIYIGRRFNKLFKPKTVHYVGGSIFIIFGILTFLGIY